MIYVISSSCFHLMIYLRAEFIVMQMFYLSWLEFAAPRSTNTDRTEYAYASTSRQRAGNCEGRADQPRYLRPTLRPPCGPHLQRERVKLSKSLRCRSSSRDSRPASKQCTAIADPAQAASRCLIGARCSMTDSTAMHLPPADHRCDPLLHPQIEP